MNRAARIAWELGGVVPRSVGALIDAGDWRALSVTGLRHTDVENPATESMTATPALILLAHARSSPTKYIRPLSHW
ncbi:hypothetical protein H7H51_19800 [Mycolicibacterium farcinogenes]|nr:hypothetical protein [Mycolicibacterium farcinogenes]